MSDSVDYITDLTVDPTPEEFCTPSPGPRFTEADFLSPVLKRLAELEQKVDMLQEKPTQMPFEKEELLDAAVYRVDALEAELIATKKVVIVLIQYFPTVLESFLGNVCCLFKKHSHG